MSTQTSVAGTLRHNLGERIRHRKPWLRAKFRQLRWQRKLVVVVRQNILDRASEVPLFPLLLQGLALEQLEVTS